MHVVPSKLRVTSFQEVKVHACVEIRDVIAIRPTSQQLHILEYPGPWLAKPVGAYYVAVALTWTGRSPGKETVSVLFLTNPRRN
jgi:hypothetical protein